METTLGAFTLALDHEAAPVTAANFIAYVDAGFYDGRDEEGATLFHRVIPGFMAQGGGLTEGLVPKTSGEPIVNESDNGRSNVRGSVAMVRLDDPDSATAQFFVNVVDNAFLDATGTAANGYAVFGEVTEGLEVVDAIVAVERETVRGYADVPVEPIVITSAVCWE